MFPQQWVNGTLATLAGFGLHDLLGKHIEGLFKGMKKGALKQGLLSFVRVATMLIVKRIIDFIYFIDFIKIKFKSILTSYKKIMFSRFIR